MGCCGKQSAQHNNYVIINGDEYFIGSNILSTFLQKLANRYQENCEYDFILLNKDTGAKVEGFLTWRRTLPYLNGRRVF